MGMATFISTQIPVTGKEREIINEEMEFNHQTYQVTCD